MDSEQSKMHEAEVNIIRREQTAGEDFAVAQVRRAFLPSSPPPKALWPAYTQCTRSRWSRSGGWHGGQTATLSSAATTRCRHDAVQVLLEQYYRRFQSRIGL